MELYSLPGTMLDLPYGHGENPGTEQTLTDNLPFVGSRQQANKSTRNMRNMTFISRDRIVVKVLATGVAALFLCLQSGSASSNNQPRVLASGASDNFALADTNHDGKLSRGETGDYLVYLVFTASDKNQDGRLTQDEWTRGNLGHLAAFKERDANQDGAVTLEEAIVYGRRGGAAVALMREADKNRDGKLDRSELQAYYASRKGSPHQAFD